MIAIVLTRLAIARSMISLLVSLSRCRATFGNQG
jgi:hypothetical protein